MTYFKDIRSEILRTSVHVIIVTIARAMSIQKEKEEERTFVRCNNKKLLALIAV